MKSNDQQAPQNVPIEIHLGDRRISNITREQVRDVLCVDMPITNTDRFEKLVDRVYKLITEMEEIVLL